MALNKINQMAQTASSLKSALDRFKTDPPRPSNALLRVDDPDLIDATKYAEKIAINNTQQINGVAITGNEGENVAANVDVLTPVDLDEFLKARKATKAREFKRLQQEQGFYFSDAMNDALLHEMRANEGYYLIGVNFNALFDLFNYSFNHSGEPLFDEDGNPIGVPEGDVLKDGDSMALIGEWIDKGREYDKILKDKVGLRMDPSTVLKPEDILDEKSRFKDIIVEGRRYTGMSRKYLNPNALYNMVRILDKYKRNEVQWLRTATAVEIVYKYMSRGATRQTFFEGRAPLDEAAIMELDEFFKTDHLFMTLAEITRLKSQLEFYRFGPLNDNINNNNINNSNINNSNINNGNINNEKNNKNT